jgi:hypothetical protein
LEADDRCYSASDKKEDIEHNQAPAASLNEHAKGSIGNDETPQVKQKNQTNQCPVRLVDRDRPYHCHRERGAAPHTEAQ